MSNPTFYRQCWLTRIETNPATTRQQMTWLPEQFAKLGKTLRLRDGKGEWSDGWRVGWVSETRLDDEAVSKRLGTIHRLCDFGGVTLD